MERYVASVASDERYAHAEGPLAADGDCALWVDIPNGDVFRAEVGYHNGLFHLADARLFCHVAGTVGAVLLTNGSADGLEKSPEVALAAGSRFLFRNRSGSFRSTSSFNGVFPETVRFNDAKVDPFGQIVAGTMAFDAASGAGGLYRIDHEGEVTTLLPHVTISNGLAWSDDGARMYYIDSGFPRICLFDYSPSGPLRNRRSFASVACGSGTPDGMCIDVNGSVWVAMWGGSQVQCFSPGGNLTAIVDIDAPHVTSCAFVGQDRDVLLVTTSQQGLSDDQIRRHPKSGALFLVDVGVRGQPQTKYRGGQARS